MSALPEDSAIVDFGQVNVQQTFWCLKTQVELKEVVLPDSNFVENDECTRNLQTELSSLDYQISCQGNNSDDHNCNCFETPQLASETSPWACPEDPYVEPVDPEPEPEPLPPVEKPEETPKVTAVRSVTPETEEEEGGISLYVIIILVLVFLLIVIGNIFICYYCCVKKQREKQRK